MSRDAGFRTVDLDTGFLDDPKVRALVRATRDEGLVSRCIVAQVAVLAASWDRGERLTLEDAAPLWLTDLDKLAEQLVRAGLLDNDQRIPEQAWTSWYVPAWSRMQGTRERWRRNAAAARDRAREDRPDSQRGPSADSPRSLALRPSSPSSPTDSSVNAPRDGRKATTGRRTNGLEKVDLLTCPACGDGPLEATDPNVTRQGAQLWHVMCPTWAIEQGTA